MFLFDFSVSVVVVLIPFRNKQIFETIYFGACEASAKLAAEDGPYKSYHGSPASRGLLQYDLWNIAPSSRWNWDALKKKIQSNGMRNSLLVASMPTASTAQVLGNSEGTDPTMSNEFSRRYVLFVIFGLVVVVFVFLIFVHIWLL